MAFLRLLRFMLKKEKRLLSNRDFRRVYEQGRYVVSRSLVLYYLPTGNESRFGFVVSKKVGGAHIRNRHKRLLREVIRLLLTRFPRGYDFVFVARPKIVGDNFGQISTVVLRLLKKAGLEKNQC
ncbi:MAG: ribonuclease P protein component [Firmicutes bacterium]|nr:ribonuclease P protein component [Bacillota bacterium]